MVFEQIDQLKKQFTDKYVVVDDSRPELRRFSGQTGVIKTVNMSGRALVEFDANLNIGWYDIELDFLKVVDKPVETDDAPQKKKVAPATATKPAAKKPAAMSVEEMMAAARANKVTATAPAKESATSQAPTKSKPPASMSVEEMLAAARANKSGDGATAEAAAKPAAAPAPEPTAAPAPAPAPEPTAPAAAQGNLPTTIPEMIAYCRQTDGS